MVKDLLTGVMRDPNSLGGFNFHQSSELYKRTIYCVTELVFPCVIFFVQCISHCSELDSG